MPSTLAGARVQAPSGLSTVRAEATQDFSELRERAHKLQSQPPSPLEDQLRRQG